MPQQINLYNPILLTPRRYFSALAMVQALGIFTAALLALSAWSVSNTVTLRQDLQSATQAHRSERVLLERTLAQQPAAPSPAALEQELAAETKQLAERRQLLNELSRGLATEGRSHSAWLRLLALTVPTPVWLTDIKLADGRVELTGATLQPDALRPWLARLAAHPLAAGRSFAALKVERRAVGSEPGSEPGSGEVWMFQVAGGGVAATPAASTGVPR